MEKTLIILKPDCMAKGIYGDVLARFARVGFEIAGCKMMQLDSAILRDHYAHVATKPFFPDIEAFMSSRPVVVLILKGDSVIDRVRRLLGPTNSREAAAGTIRGDMGTDMMVNVCHASDSPEAAQAEIKRFFREDEIFG